MIAKVKCYGMSVDKKVLGLFGEANFLRSRCLFLTIVTYFQLQDQMTLSWLRQLFKDLGILFEIKVRAFQDFGRF